MLPDHVKETHPNLYVGLMEHFSACPMPHWSGTSTCRLSYLFV